ncbi:gas vesicle protein GvpC [Trichocoleus sp. FACHB-591]|uniref:gas vesicle protein GvpC n=1 Tax=Trichocoleus sp. FACHB-591 TaxID=2692872 RepID=UPI0016844AB7|nr:gas vesicle protein GvpC [Trichocoleus sp. FACHB-591]MBD2097059.1 gas vesicle protein GvpC [Trichocoleus sp. FACHB-591]
MVALRNLWQEQRRQRQQQLAQRQQQVQAALAATRQQRQIRAAQVHHNLAAFRADLTEENELRQANQHLFRLQLQQSVQALQQETQNFLAYSRLERQIQAEELAEQLDSFVQQLQQQTAEFLSLTAIERSLMAEQLAQELCQFHSKLNASVTLLRQEIQTRVSTLQQETQALLSTSQHERVLMRTQQAKELTTFVEKLSADVQSYLWELELLREDRAQQMQQTLSQSRSDRQARVAALFQRFATFRTELQQYCTNLRTSVWGADLENQLTQSQTSPPSPLLQERGATDGQRSNSEPTSAPIPPAQPTPVDIEKEVYNYIHQVQGARLAELETALTINRIQAVDVLRSLITKGLITQRDRVYYTQEEFNL